MTALEARGVTVRFGHGQQRLTAVDRVDLAVPERTTVGLVGESGSGKSTLARALVGLVPLAAGEVLLDDERVRVARNGRVTDRRRRVQVIFQDPFSSLSPRMTIGAMLSEALTVRGGYGRSARAAAVREYLDLVHLDADLAGQLPSRLSGGQRQRVAIARALARGPEVLIADEITSSLDVSVQSAVLNLMRDLQQRLGHSMVFVSHNLATVRYVSDVLAVMYLGRIVEVGPTDAVVSDPQHPYTRTLLDAVPRLGQTSLGEEGMLEGDAPDPRHPPSGCHFHPALPGRAHGRPDQTGLRRPGPVRGRRRPAPSRRVSLRRRRRRRQPRPQEEARCRSRSIARRSRNGSTTCARSTTCRARPSRCCATAPSCAAASGILNLDTGVEATADSLFQIGSITKVWTATVVMQLVEEGRVELDAPVRRYLPEFRVADEDVSASVTVRHLLTHTSGIDGDHFADTGRGDDALAAYVESCAAVTQVHPLGATMSYCNTGFSILGRIVEVVTDAVWDEAIRTRLAEPLELTHTATLAEDVLRFRAAIGHIEPPGHERRTAPMWGLPRSAGPAGGICSTASDLLGFAALHLGGASPSGDRLLRDDSLAAMREPLAVVPSGIGPFPPRWGLGLVAQRVEREAGASGTTAGRSGSPRSCASSRRPASRSRCSRTAAIRSRSSASSAARSWPTRQASSCPPRSSRSPSSRPSTRRRTSARTRARAPRSRSWPATAGSSPCRR